jgi:hypothetical protein
VGFQKIMILERTSFENQQINFEKWCLEDKSLQNVFFHYLNNVENIQEKIWITSIFSLKNGVWKTWFCPG